MKRKKVLDLANMDKGTPIELDFFRHVNGGWLDKTEIPSDKSKWGSFYEVREENLEVLRHVLEKSKAHVAAGSDQAKALDFYSVGLSKERADAKGLSPIENQLAEIEALSSLEALVDHISVMQVNGVEVFIGGGVFADLKQSAINTYYLGPADLGLPDRDYYLLKDSQSKTIRSQYVTHLQEAFVMLGKSKEAAFKTAQAVLAFETRIAEALLDKVARRNPYNIYHPHTHAELVMKYPRVNWSAYFKGIALPDAGKQVVLTQPKAFARLNELLESTELALLKDYMRWRVYHTYAPYLHEAATQHHFNFYGKVLGGTKEMEPRWQRVLRAVNSTLGDAVGQLYVKEAFPPEAKDKAVKMVEYLKKAYQGRIKGLSWMSEDTKVNALKKLETMQVKIGYPDKWERYDSLHVKSNEASSYAENVRLARHFHHHKDIKKAYQPVDKTKWEMNAQTVNAYYNPLNNEIVFPAAILQAPFYYYYADEAINYGGIGAVIGHEISHAFDDQGSRFDADGNLANWWSDSDRQQFEAATKVLVEQYNRYEVLDSLYVNGAFTLGENIADLGGLASAFDALQLFYADHGDPNLIDGYTGEQRFFLSWATIWRIKYRKDALRTHILTDPHSPGAQRANGPVSNLESFYAAFGIKEGDSMWRATNARAKIW